MVGVEQRDVEVVADTVRGKQPLDHADQRVLLGRGGAVAERSLEVAEQRDVLRQRHARDGLRLECARPPQMPERSLGLRKAVEGEGIPREGRERDAHVARGSSRRSGRQLEQAELDARPGVCLVCTDGCRRRELHCVRRSGCVSE